MNATQRTGRIVLGEQMNLKVEGVLLRILTKTAEGAEEVEGKFMYSFGLGFEFLLAGLQIFLGRFVCF